MTGTQTQGDIHFSIFKQVTVRKAFPILSQVLSSCHGPSFPSWSYVEHVSCLFSVVTFESSYFVQLYIFFPSLSLPCLPPPLRKECKVIERTPDFHTRLGFKSQLCHELCNPRHLYSLTSVNGNSNDIPSRVILGN